jgi:hypothetical protein
MLYPRRMISMMELCMCTVCNDMKQIRTSDISWKHGSGLFSMTAETDGIPSPFLVWTIQSCCSIDERTSDPACKDFGSFLSLPQLGY